RGASCRGGDQRSARARRPPGRARHRRSRDRISCASRSRRRSGRRSARGVRRAPGSRAWLRSQSDSDQQRGCLPDRGGERSAARGGRRADRHAAEENGGGKIELLRKGIFDRIVAALSSHPAGQGGWSVSGTGLGVVGKRVTFTGVASHAGSAPEKGRNALNAVIRFFVGIDGWRQQLETDSRVHGYISDGGKAMNVVPARAEAIFGLRAKERKTLDGMVERFGEIAKGAALLTGTNVEIAEYLPYYEPVKANLVLGDVIAAELATHGVTPERGILVTASTDLGNVSTKVPTD